MDERQPQNLNEAQRLIDELRATNQQLSATNAQLTDTVTDLQSQLAWMKRQLFGSKSERVTDSGGPGLFDDQPEPAEATEPSANDQSEPTTQTETVTYQRKAPRRGKRQPIPDDVPRVDRIHDLPEQDKAGLKCIGRQVTEELEAEPGKLYAVRHIQYTYAREEEDLSPEPAQPNVLTAAKPEEGLARCLAGPTLLALIVVSKFADHLPLHRLEGMLARHGMKIARSSMCRWVQDLAAMVEPLLALMKSLVLESRFIRGDETPVRQQEQGRGKAKTCYFYSYLGDADHPYTLYDYRGHRARAGPNAWFSDEEGNPRYHGLLQCDAYTGYAELFDPDKPWRMTQVGCWAHARRKFYDVRDQFPGPCHHVLGRIRQLYDVEREATDQQLDTQQRQALRDQKSRPIVEALFEWAEQQQAQVLPKSGLGEAITYMLNQAEALRRYLDDGRLEIDNNTCERSLRGIAVGRSNWIFTGSQAGGEAAAAMFSLIASAKRNNLNVYRYLSDLFRRLPSTPTSQLHQFLPDRWQAPHV